MKPTLKQFILFCIATFVLVFLYGYLHEFAHFVTCKGFGLESTIYVNPFLKSPEYVTFCPGSASLSSFGFFIVRSVPYILSAILMFGLLVFFKPKSLFHLSIPSAILLSDWLNVLDLTKFFSGTSDFRNDFLQVYFILGKGPFILLGLILGITTGIYGLLVSRMLRDLGKELKGGRKYERYGESRHFNR